MKFKEEINVNWSLQRSGTSAGPCRLVEIELSVMGLSNRKMCEPGRAGSMCPGLWGTMAEMCMCVCVCVCVQGNNRKQG